MTRLTRSRVSAIGAAAMVLAATLAGCGGGSDSGSQAAKAAGGAPQRGGELVYLDAEIPISAQVQESGYWQDRALLQNVLDRLLYRNPETHEIEPWIAESWKVSKDGTTYDFVIREGVSYSDGQPLDVESVKRNLEWQINGDDPNGITPNPVFPKEATITTDPATRTVSVELPEPYAPFLAVLTTWSAGLVADATIEKSRDEQSRFNNLIGSGAFVVTTEQYGKKYVLSARKEYEWAPPSWENQGAAYVDQVTVIPVQEDAVRLGTLKSGQAHLLRYVQPSEERALAEQGYEVVAATGVGLSNQWFIRQDAAPYLKDERVRKALLVGIDRETIVEDLYTDSWSAATSVLSPGTVGYKDQSAKLAYDPDAANQLLDEAGWTERNAEGFRTKDGRQLDVLTYVDVFDNTAPALFQSIQVQLKEARRQPDHQADGLLHLQRQGVGEPEGRGAAHRLAGSRRRDRPLQPVRARRRRVPPQGRRQAARRAARQAADGEDQGGGGAGARRGAGLHRRQGVRDPGHQ